MAMEDFGDGYVRSGSFRGSEDNGGDSVSYEKFLLDDLDSYWDDLNSRLTVSRMVNDSIIKGMVSGVVEEADEKIASKDAEIAVLRERLRGHRLKAVGTSATEVKFSHSDHFARLRLAVEERVGSVRRAESLAEVDENVDGLEALLEVVFQHVDKMICSPEDEASEEQLENELEKEVVDIVTRDSIKAMHDEFETKLYEQREISCQLSMNWQTTLHELSDMREELDAISRSFSMESGSLLSYNSIEHFEERHATKGRDNSPRNVIGNHHVSFVSQPDEDGSHLTEKVMVSPKPVLEDADSPKLKHMTKEEVISYYRTEMLKMSRRHDQVVQDKTEALFKLKREFLKEKGSSHLRKDKDFEVSRKKIPDVIAKLDSILFLSKKLPTLNNDLELSNFKKGIDALLFENQQLRTLLTDERKEVKSLSAQVSNAASQMLIYSSLDGNFLEQIKKLKREVDDLKIEAKIRCDVYNSLLKELVDEHKCGMEDIQSKLQILQDINFLIFKGAVDDVMSVVNPSDSKNCMETSSLEGVLSEKEKALCLALEENNKLKQDISSLVTSIAEKEKLLSETGFTLGQQEKQFDLVNGELNQLRDQLSELNQLRDQVSELKQLRDQVSELNQLRDQVSKQETLLTDKNTELVSIQGRLDETLQQIQQHKLEIDELNEELKMSSESLIELEKQNTIFLGIIQEKQKAFSSSITKENTQANQMKTVVVSLIEDLEKRLFENIEINESRLKVLDHHCVLLRQHASLLRQKELWYQQIIEIKSCNLQKAEDEVDLLGDEVDALMSLLGKIYIALDHYSPIFELYPGVMEILKLVQRKLKEEANMLV